MFGGVCCCGSFVAKSDCWPSLTGCHDSTRIPEIATKIDRNGRVREVTFDLYNLLKKDHIKLDQVRNEIAQSIHQEFRSLRVRGMTDDYLKYLEACSKGLQRLESKLSFLNDVQRRL